jgi:hypothetical protein
VVADGFAPSAFSVANRPTTETLVAAVVNA